MLSRTFTYSNCDGPPALAEPEGYTMKEVQHCVCVSWLDRVQTLVGDNRDQMVVLRSLR